MCGFLLFFLEFYLFYFPFLWLLNVRAANVFRYKEN